MADSKVEIEVTADTKGVKKGMAEVEAATEKAMEAGANSAKKLAKAIDDVEKSQKKLAEESKLTARNLRGIASGMASMAMGVAGIGLRMGGHEREGAYLGGASQGAAQGAGMMAPLGGAGMLAGAIGGGILGFVKTGLEREEQGRKDAEAMGDLADALEKAREKMQEAKERADSFAGTLNRLSDVSRSTSEREAERASEIEKRQNAVAEATERMTAAEKALRDQAAAIDGPQTEEQRKAAERIREAWAEANQDLQTAQSELDRLKSANIEAAKKADLKPLDQRGDGPQLSNLEKLGASFGSAADNLAREGNRIAEESLSVLKDINAKAGAPASFA